MLLIVVPYYNLLLYSCENYFSLSQRHFQIMTQVAHLFFHILQHCESKHVT